MIKPCEANELFSNTPCSYCDYKQIQACQKALYKLLNKNDKSSDKQRVRTTKLRKQEK